MTVNFFGTLEKSFFFGIANYSVSTTPYVYNLDLIMEELGGMGIMWEG